MVAAMVALWVAKWSFVVCMTGWVQRRELLSGLDMPDITVNLSCYHGNCAICCGINVISHIPESEVTALRLITYHHCI